MKTCNCCGETKSLDQFYDKLSRKGVVKKEARCRECILAKKAERYDPLKKRAADLKSGFGISIEDYDKLLQEQDGVCAICRGPHRGRGKHFHVDHCHDTGKVRGLLCSPCNVGMGMLNHDISRIQQVINYLQKHA